MRERELLNRLGDSIAAIPEVDESCYFTTWPTLGSRNAVRVHWVMRDRGFSVVAALRGEIELLYVAGRQWTARPFPRRDAFNAIRLGFDWFRSGDGLEALGIPYLYSGDPP